jgi:superfamily II DNA/RNA helicase
VAHDLALPPRRPEHPPIELSGAERELYRLTVTYVRDLYREGFVQEDDSATDRRRRRRTGKGILILELMRLCQRLTSSSRALAESLRSLAQGDLVTPDYRRAARELAAEADAVAEHAKLAMLERILADHGDQLIVFSEHLPTLKMIHTRVRELGRPAIVFQGGLSLAERIQRLAQFQREPAGVFIATRSGTEGLNLQFCNRMVNYELPWNPMMVEQRIGRIHRIGQTREAHIINFSARGTIESHILTLLDQKIQLFRLVVGELDVILGEYGGGERLEKTLRDAFLSSDSDDAFARRLETIGREIETSREAGFQQEQAASLIAPDDNAARLEREFNALTHAGRLRLGYGTKHVTLKQGIEAKRQHLRLHVNELLEALDTAAPAAPAGNSDYGALVRITGVTGLGRTVEVIAQADRLPMVITDLFADP